MLSLSRNNPFALLSPSWPPSTSPPLIVIILYMSITTKQCYTAYILLVIILKTAVLFKSNALWRSF